MAEKLFKEEALHTFTHTWREVKQEKRNRTQHGFSSCSPIEFMQVREENT
jgi:hypothetical protein